MKTPQEEINRELYRKELLENVRIARNVLRITLGTALLVLLFLGVTVVSGCEVIYQPACTTDCQGMGGADSYSRGGY